MARFGLDRPLHEQWTLDKMIYRGTMFRICLPATDALHVVERFTRPSIGRMAIAVTIDDPKAYTRPWTVDLSWSLVPDVELIESICEENNKAAHLPTVPQ